MEEGRREADSLLARVNLDYLPAAVKIGIAPAMGWDLSKSFWVSRDVDTDTATLYAGQSSTCSGRPVRDEGCNDQELAKLFG